MARCGRNAIFNATNGLRANSKSRRPSEDTNWCPWRPLPNLIDSTTLQTRFLRRFQTANSIFDAYGHEVEIDVLGIVTQSVVYFFAEPSIRKNVLGRSGWLDRVRLGLVDHDRELYLAAYDHHPE